jgi:lipopolysaccharide/colanic/teichoic acid biosynthesis glycosyltransferase
MSFLPILILLWTICLFESRSPLLKQQRVGYKGKLFLLIKFRTMKINAKLSATHRVDNVMITPFGYVLRSTKLDEIPQLLNVLVGDMSLVGPRPCLSNQKRLITERKKRGIYKVKPGITGLAQISGINMSRPVLLAKTDLKMIKQMNLFYYFYYIFKTVLLIFRKRS